MPVAPTYPGVYIEEIPSGVRTITGVATSIAAFVDFFKRGPMNKAVQIFSMADFEREFGGLDPASEASYAVQQFFLNGGLEAWIVRVASGAVASASVCGRAKTDGGGDVFTVTAISEGTWGNNLRVGVDYDTTDPSDPPTRFNLTVSEVATVSGRTVVVGQESFRNLSMSRTLPAPAPPNTPDPDYVDTVVNDPNTGSKLITFTPETSTTLPVASGTLSTPGATFPVDPPAAGAPLRLRVTFDIAGTSEQEDVNLGTTSIESLEDAATRLEAAIRNAKAADPARAQTTVRVVRGRLQIIAGPSAPNAIITFAAAPADPSGTPVADNNTVNNLKLRGAGVIDNVAQYELGATTKLRARRAGGIVGNDGTPPDATALIGSDATDPPTGLFALDKVDVFNILCLPRIARVGEAPDFAEDQVDYVVYQATKYCEDRWAFLILDAPSNQVKVPQIKAWLAAKDSLRHKNAAFYFPRVLIADPLNNFRLRSFGASGTIAGLYARTDVARGCWKAAGGTEAVLRGVQKLDYKLTDQENGTLNPLGINCLRTFDVYGNVCWGARTLRGSDQLASEWKYIPVRRLALFIEQSLYRGTKWVVFEPNDEPLWSNIRLNVGAFMHSLFRQGAFQGQTPREAYFVKCDKETTTQNDINLGIVNIVVGFAPLKPAEFVIIKIQQIAGQIQM